VAVAAAPEAVEVGGGLAGVAAALVCFALWLVWRFTIGFVILRLADMFARVAVPKPWGGHFEPLGFAADALRTVDRNVNNALWNSMLACEHFAVWLFLETAHQTAATAGAVKESVVAIDDAMRRVEASYLPWMFRSHVGPVVKDVGTIKRQTKTMDKQLHQTTAQAKTTAKVAHNTIAVALPRVETGSKTRDKTLAKDATGLKGRVQNLEKVTSHAALVALIGATFWQFFQRSGLGWLRCRNVGRIGRGICGAPNALVASLMTEALEIAVLTDLCDVVRLAELAAEEFEPVFKDLVALQDNLCLFGGAKRPSAVPLKTQTPPSWLPSAV
jgi:hypothetical protein